MKNYLYLIVLTLLSCSKKSNDTITAIVPVTPTAPVNYVIGKSIIWQDEFNYSGLPDSTKWSYDIGGDGWGNHELEYYVKSLKNSYVDNGILTIQANYEKTNERNYSSARLVTKNKGDWKYGRFEIKAKIPSGLGTWPAIWMLASEQTFGNTYWPDNGEIDIMEHVGYDPNVVHATLHTKAFNAPLNNQITNTLTVPTAFTDFHIYALEWFPNYINIYIDDKMILTYNNPQSGWDKWPFSQKFHLLLNIAVGGDWGGLKGVDNSVFPQKMEIDYVRVYPLVAE